MNKNTDFLNVSIDQIHRLGLNRAILLTALVKLYSDACDNEQLDDNAKITVHAHDIEYLTGLSHKQQKRILNALAKERYIEGYFKEQENGPDVICFKPLFNFRVAEKNRNYYVGI